MDECYLVVATSLKVRRLRDNSMKALGVNTNHEMSKIHASVKL